MIKIRYALLFSSLRLVSELPFKEALASLLEIISRPFRKKDQRWLYFNLALVFRLSPHSYFAKSFEKQVYRHQFLALLETMSALFKTNKDTIEFEGLDLLRTKLDLPLVSEKGFIVTTAHIGSWEFVAHCVARASSKKFYVLAKPSKSKLITSLLESLRSNMGVKVLWTNRKGLLKDMIDVLKSRQGLGFVMDQKPDNRVGPVVSFLGQSTEFVSGPAKLACKFQVPVIGVYCIRLSENRYRVMSELIWQPGEVFLDETNLTQKMATSIENCVRSYPEQWVWNYKRWRPKS